MKVVGKDEVQWVEGKGYRKRILFTKNDLPMQANALQYMEIKSGATVAPHYHEQTSELFYVIQGTPVFTIDDKSTQLKPGDALLCEAGEVHSVDNPGEDFIYLSFKINPTENDSKWCGGKQ